MAPQWLNTLGWKLRHTTNRFFRWGDGITSGQLAVSSGAHRQMQTWKMRTPQYFPDIDTYAALLVALGERGTVEVNAGNFRIEVPKGGELEAATRIANRPKPERTNLGVAVRGEPGSGSIYINFRQRGGGGITETALSDSEHGYESLAHTISNYTSRLPRKMRRRTTPLIEPLRAEDESRARQNHELTKVARRSGALWGFLTALAVAVVTLLIQGNFTS